MKVKIIAVAASREVLGGKSEDYIVLEENKSLLDLMNLLGIGLSHPYVYTINEKITAPENYSKTKLCDNDTVKIVSIVSGG